MIYFLVHDSEGRILRVGTCQEETLELQAGDGEVSLETASLATSDHYVLEGEVVDRPSMPLVYLDPLTATVDGTINISGIPEGTTVTYPGGEIVVDDGYIQWSSAESGDFQFRFELFPYRDEVLNAHITDV